MSWTEYHHPIIIIIIMPLPLCDSLDSEQWSDPYALTKVPWLQVQCLHPPYLLILKNQLPPLGPGCPECDPLMPHSASPGAHYKCRPTKSDPAFPQDPRGHLHTGFQQNCTRKHQRQLRAAPATNPTALLSAGWSSIEGKLILTL